MAKSVKAARSASKKDVKKVEKKESSSESSSSDSSSSDSESSSGSDSSSDSEDEAPKVVAKKEASKKEKKAAESSSSESSSSGSDSSDSSDSEDEAPAKVEEKTEEKKEDKASSSDDSSDSSSDSSDSESESESASAEKSKDSSSASDSDSSSKKRKAEESSAEETPKKAKAETSEPATLFVGRLSWNVDDAMLKESFDHIGGVVGARVIYERSTGKSRGYGYVDFESKTFAEKALSEMQGAEIDGRPVNLDMSTAKPQQGNDRVNQRARDFGDVKSDPSDTVFLGNLSFQADRDAVYEAFSSFGNIISVRIPTHPGTEDPKGFGYVQYGSVDEAKAAVEGMNGEYVAGRPVRLDYSTPKAPSSGPGNFRGSPGPRGGFGGRGGRGGRGGFGGRERASGANNTPVKSEFKGTKKKF